MAENHIMLTGIFKSCQWWITGVLNLGYARSLQGYVKLKKKHANEANFGIIFYLGVREGDTSLIWGYAEVYNFDLGVREYHKVENPW
jgi:hypothetical protein